MRKAKNKTTKQGISERRGWNTCPVMLSKTLA